nr:RNA-directed DNA polymerase, eukaryota [Tanacetum cinerariifolium]
MHGLLSDSFRRPIRGGIEAQQLAQLQDLVGTSILSTSADQWVCNLSGDGTFHVKNIRCLLDEFFLPDDSIATRWVKFIPIKINVFAWRVCLDRLPTRMNLCRRNIQVPDLPVCKNVDEEVSHLLFSCPLSGVVHRLVCRWWNLAWSPLSSYEEWLSWFKDIRLGSILKSMLEGVFYVSWCKHIRSMCLQSYQIHHHQTDRPEPERPPNPPLERSKPNPPHERLPPKSSEQSEPNPPPERPPPKPLERSKHNPPPNSPYEICEIHRLFLFLCK